MQTLFSCPACGQKLKVAPASVGKKVKCPCGTIFVAEAPPPVVVPEPEPVPEVTPLAFEDEARPAGDRRSRAADADWVDHASRPKPVRETPPVVLRPRRSPVVSTFVVLIVLAYVGVLVPTYLGYLDPYLPEPPPRVVNFRPGPPRAMNPAPENDGENAPKQPPGEPNP
jgi:hypothetical protein